MEKKSFVYIFLKMDKTQKKVFYREESKTIFFFFKENEIKKQNIRITATFQN